MALNELLSFKTKLNRLYSFSLLFFLFLVCVNVTHFMVDEADVVVETPAAKSGVSATPTTQVVGETDVVENLVATGTKPSVSTTTTTTDYVDTLQDLIPVLRWPQNWPGTQKLGPLELHTGVQSNSELPTFGAQFYRHAFGTHKSLLSYSLGKWDEQKTGCATPKLWLLLFGQYRSFMWLKFNHRRALRQFLRDDSQCYFVVFVTGEIISSGRGGSDEINANGAVAKSIEHATWEDEYLTSEQRRSSNRSNILAEQRLLRDQYLFDEQFAYIVERRTDEREIFYPQLWTSWFLARWVARYHGFEIDPFSIVLRHRPDVSFCQNVSLAELPALWRASNAWWMINDLGSQDIQAIFAFAALEWAVSRPFLHATVQKNESLLYVVSDNSFGRHSSLVDPPRYFTECFNLYSDTPQYYTCPLIQLTHVDKIRGSIIRMGNTAFRERMRFNASCEAESVDESHPTLIHDHLHVVYPRKGNVIYTRPYLVPLTLNQLVCAKYPYLKGTDMMCRTKIGYKLGES